MFLDDKLLQIARNADDTTEEGLIKSISEMINICFENLSKSINKGDSDSIIIANFRRINLTWKLVAEKLKKENKCFIREDGFKRFVESKPEFKGIFFNN